MDLGHKHSRPTGPWRLDRARSASPGPCSQRPQNNPCTCRRLLIHLPGPNRETKTKCEPLNQVPISCDTPSSDLKIVHTFATNDPEPHKRRHHEVLAAAAPADPLVTPAVAAAAEVAREPCSEPARVAAADDPGATTANSAVSLGVFQEFTRPDSQVAGGLGDAQGRKCVFG